MLLLLRLVVLLGGMHQGSGLMLGDLLLLLLLLLLVGKLMLRLMLLRLQLQLLLQVRLIRPLKVPLLVGWDLLGM
jgi:hypothetical protein